MLGISDERYELLHFSALHACMCVFIDSRTHWVLFARLAIQRLFAILAHCCIYIYTRMHAHWQYDADYVSFVFVCILFAVGAHIHNITIDCLEVNENKRCVFFYWFLCCFFFSFCCFWVRIHHYSAYSILCLCSNSNINRYYMQTFI